MTPDDPIFSSLTPEQQELVLSLEQEVLAGTVLELEDEYELVTESPSEAPEGSVSDPEAEAWTLAARDEQRRQKDLEWAFKWTEGLERVPADIQKLIVEVDALPADDPTQATRPLASALSDSPGHAKYKPKGKLTGFRARGRCSHKHFHRSCPDVTFYPQVELEDEIVAKRVAVNSFNEVVYLQDRVRVTFFVYQGKER